MSSSLEKLVRWSEADQLGWTNWLHWKLNIILVLHNLSLLGHIDGDTPIPPNYVELPAIVDSNGTILTPASTADNSDAVRDWVDADQRIQAWLVLNINDFLTTGITYQNEMASETWNQILRKCERRNVLMASNLEDYLRTLKCAEGEDLNAHFAELWRRWNAAKEAGTTWTEDALIIAICKSVPALFLSITQPIMLNIGAYDGHSCMDTILMAVGTLKEMSGAAPVDVFRGKSTIAPRGGCYYGAAHHVRWPPTFNC